MAVFFGILPPMPTITKFSFAGDVQNIRRGMIPRIQGRSYAIEAELTIPEDGAEGVIVANADFIGGFALWLDDKGILNHTYSLPLVWKNTGKKLPRRFLRGMLM